MNQALQSTRLSLAIDDIRNCTDNWPWYWYSYGEKCYAFAVVSAFPADESQPFPLPGTELVQRHDKVGWFGENGVEMVVDDVIARHEKQSGDSICQFIAIAHAELVQPPTTVNP